jgi:hypothetical protein
VSVQPVLDLVIEMPSSFDFSVNSDLFSIYVLALTSATTFES